MDPLRAVDPVLTVDTVLTTGLGVPGLRESCDLDLVHFSAHSRLL